MQVASDLNNQDFLEESHHLEQKDRRTYPFDKVLHLVIFNTRT